MEWSEYIQVYPAGNDAEQRAERASGVWAVITSDDCLSLSWRPCCKTDSIEESSFSATPITSHNIKPLTSPQNCTPQTTPFTQKEVRITQILLLSRKYQSAVHSISDVRDLGGGTGGGWVQARPNVAKTIKDAPSLKRPSLLYEPLRFKKDRKSAKYKIKMRSGEELLHDYCVKFRE